LPQTQVMVSIALSVTSAYSMLLVMMSPLWIGLVQVFLLQT